MAEHSLRTRAAALAAIATGESVAKVSRDLGVSRSTIARWRDQAHLPPATANRQEQVSEIGALLLDFLRETLITTTHMVRFMRDEDWLRRQPADQMGLAFGIATDKAFRLASAMRGPDPESTGVIEVVDAEGPPDA